VEVKLGNIDLTPKASATVPPLPRGEGRGEGEASVEAGTGFYERRFATSDIKPRLGEITVRKLDEGVAWGSVHWQYLEDISKVTPHTGTPLKLKKALFTKVNTKKGPVLEPVKGAVQVGMNSWSASNCALIATWNTSTSRTSAAAAPNR